MAVLHRHFHRWAIRGGEIPYNTDGVPVAGGPPVARRLPPRADPRGPRDADSARLTLRTIRESTFSHGCCWRADSGESRESHTTRLATRLVGLSVPMRTRA